MYNDLFNEDCIVKNLGYFQSSTNTKNDVMNTIVNTVILYEGS